MSKQDFENLQDTMPENYHAEAAQQAADEFEAGLKVHNEKASKEYFKDIDDIQSKWDGEMKINYPDHRELGSHE